MKKILLMGCIIATITTYAEENYFNNVNGDNNQIRLEETIISTTGFTESVGNVSQNVEVITEKEIKEKNYRTVDEILDDMSGITKTGPMIDIRGQGKGAKHRILYMVDGIPINVTMETGTVDLNTINISSVERVEVITGGGSVVYGDGASGGVINIITKNPNNKKREHRVALEAGSYNELTTKLNTGFKIGNNKFDISALVRKRDGHINDSNSDKNSFSLRSYHQLTKDQNLNLRFQYNDETIYDGFPVSKEIVDRDRKDVPLSYLMDRESFNFSAEYNNHINKKTKLNTTIYYFDGEEYFKKSDFPNFIKTVIDAPKFGLKTKLQYKYSLNSNIIAGFDYSSQDADQTYLDNAFGRDNLMLKSTKTSTSFYILNNSKINKWSFSQGLRYQNSKFKINNSHDGITEPYINNYDKNMDNIAFHVDAGYSYSETGNFYAKYEKGFVQPIGAQLVDYKFYTGEFDDNNLKEEIKDSYEIGFKDFIAGSFVRASLYYSKSKDEIIRKEPNPITGVFEAENLGKSERKGIEFFAEQYFDKFTLSQSFNYVDAKIKSGADNGKKLPQVSPITAALKINYKPLENLSLNLTGKYKSSYYQDPQNLLEKADAVMLFNAAFRYSYNTNLDIYGSINNVFDEEYYSQAGYHGTGYVPAEGRNFRVGAEYKF